MIRELRLLPLSVMFLLGYDLYRTEQYTDPIPNYCARYTDDCIGTSSCYRVDLEWVIIFVPASTPIQMGNQ